MEAKKVRSIATVAGISVTFVVAGFWIVFLQKQATSFQSKLDDQTALAQKALKERDGLLTLNTALHERLDLGQTKGSADGVALERMRDSLGAFAKQAAACESLRPRLMLGGSAS